jgi:hypothetical protein
MIARLFHDEVEDGDQAVGCATVGSSEAIMLAGLAFKHKWQNKRKAQGKPYDNPNIVTGSNVQVCWHCVLNLDTSIVVTQNFVNMTNFEFVCLDMAPGYRHKGVARAGLLALQEEHGFSITFPQISSNPWQWI